MIGAMEIEVIDTVDLGERELTVNADAIDTVAPWGRCGSTVDTEVIDD